MNTMEISSLQYDGQKDGKIALLDGETFELLFSEKDRKLALDALNNRHVNPALFSRLNVLHQEGESIQALYFLSQYAVHGLIKAEFTL